MISRWEQYNTTVATAAAAVAATTTISTANSTKETMKRSDSVAYRNISGRMSFMRQRNLCIANCDAKARSAQNQQHWIEWWTVGWTGSRAKEYKMKKKICMKLYLRPPTASISARVPLKGIRIVGPRPHHINLLAIVFALSLSFRFNSSSLFMIIIISGQQQHEETIKNKIMMGWLGF